jgi:ABC-type phosphate/phosphonate transport system substrate-binding protein
MNLSPLAAVKIGGEDQEEYSVIVKKGAYKTLSQLKGKTLAGNILYEDKKFINTMVFDNKIDISKHFKIKPSNRPLSAVRKLDSGQFDAVILNHMQYISLKNLDIFKNIQVIHSSPKMPALGLMMINTKANNAAKDKIVNAITRMCGQEDTKAACKNFGIDGFDKLEAETLANEITKYEGAK